MIFNFFSTHEDSSTKYCRINTTVYIFVLLHAQNKCIKKQNKKINYNDDNYLNDSQYIQQFMLK